MKKDWRLSEQKVRFQDIFTRIKNPCFYIVCFRMKNNGSRVFEVDKFIYWSRGDFHVKINVRKKKT